MQIDRQTQLPLQGGSQGEIGGSAAVDHQGIAHGGGGAVQIEGHQTGIGSLGAMGGEQGPGPFHLRLAPVRISEQLGGEAAVEIAVAVAPARREGLGIADQGDQGQA
jgi:hypothetical protein